MTKAKDALDFLYGSLGYDQNVERYETIRKALELLDKVERGGVDVYDMFLDNCNYEEDNYDAGWNHAIADINEKYILIERQ